MMRRHRTVIIPLVLTLALLSGCVTAPTAPAAPTVAPTAPREPLTLTIVHTNDTLGYLRPCG